MCRVFRVIHLFRFFGVYGMTRVSGHLSQCARVWLSDTEMKDSRQVWKRHQNKDVLDSDTVSLKKTVRNGNGLKSVSHTSKRHAPSLWKTFFSPLEMRLIPLSSLSSSLSSLSLFRHSRLFDLRGILETQSGPSALQQMICSSSCLVHHRQGPQALWLAGLSETSQFRIHWKFRFGFCPIHHQGLIWNQSSGVWVIWQASQSATDPRAAFGGCDVAWQLAMLT